MSYNAENQLVGVTGPSLTASFLGVYPERSRRDGGGARVKSTINGTTSYFVGGHYIIPLWDEVTGSQVTKYYFAGSQRIAVRKNGTLSYMVSTGSTHRLSDHLGSTVATTNTSGQLVSGQIYKAWGEVRYSLGTSPTKYTFTGQYSNVSEFGLLFYNARWYDPVSGRFAQADTIVPAGVQGLDRYAYVNNSPLNFVDPTGHFTENAIKNYLRGYCENEKACYESMLKQWQADTEWWDMLSAAQEGDILYGTATLLASGGGTVAFGFTFEGKGEDVLAGITPVGNAEGARDITLSDIQQGHGQSVGYDVKLTWMGLYRESTSPQDSFPYIRPGYEPEFVGTPNEAVRTEAKSDAMLLGILACATTRSFAAVVGCAWAVDAGEEKIFDWLNIEKNDYQVNTGPIVFTLQLESGSSAMWNIEEIAWWSTVR